MEEQNKYISDLLIRYVNGLYTRNDIETLRKLASSITERAELESEMDRVWNEAQDLPQSDSHNHLLYKKEAQDLLDKTRKRERRISLSTFIKYAASIAIIVSIGFGAKLYLNHSAKQHTSASDHLLTEISVNHGEHKQVTLPDGTVVHLNAGTVMRYPTEFTSDIRLVEMEGEAFFPFTSGSVEKFYLHPVAAAGENYDYSSNEIDVLLAQSEVQERLELGMAIRDVDGMDTIRGEACVLFALGTEHPDQFVAEYYYAVSSSGLVYRMDDLTGEWEPI